MAMRCNNIRVCCNRIASTSISGVLARCAREKIIGRLVGRGSVAGSKHDLFQAAGGACVASWLALDDADEKNGALFVVPGSQTLGVLCTHAADLTRSFTTEEVAAPADLKTIGLDLQAGDMVILHGGVIHGSYPNTTTDRFRRAPICHYVPQSTAAMNGGHYPLYTFSGEKIEREKVEGGTTRAVAARPSLVKRIVARLKFHVGKVPLQRFWPFWKRPRMVIIMSVVA